MQTCQIEGRTKPLTLKRGSAEYFNEDCPNIYSVEGYRIFHSDITGVYINTDKSTRLKIYKFIKSSYALFCKKYPHIGNGGALNWIEDIKTIDNY